MQQFSQIQIPSNNPAAFVGRVYLPSDVDRDEYVEVCLKNYTVSIIDLSFNRIIHGVRVGKLAMREIEFPLGVGTNPEIGSAVLCINLPLKEQYVVTDVIMSSNGTQEVSEEESFRVTRASSNTSVDFHIKGSTGELDITVDSGDGTDTESNLNFYNKKSNASLKTYVQGILTFISDKIFTLQSYQKILMTVQGTAKNAKVTNMSIEVGKGFLYSDEFGNEVKIDKDGAVTVKAKKKVILGEDAYAMVLGDVLKDILGLMMDGLSQATTTVAGAQVPLTNSAVFSAIKQQLPKILSKYGYLK